MHVTFSDLFELEIRWFAWKSNQLAPKNKILIRFYFPQTMR